MTLFGRQNDIERMEVVDAVGSVLRIAEVGAQLSLNLFKVASSVGSVNRDVQYVAKDIAFFSTTLKDLGNTLSKGKKSKLYREDAYQTGFGTAKECEEVLEEIQDILNKFNEYGGATPASIRRIDKLGIFRIDRVQMIRGKLEFLKSKIFLQVAVLSYAEMVSTSSSSTADFGGLLALKSLVLANETTNSAFQELSTKSTEGSSLGNPISILDDPRSRGSRSNSTSQPPSSPAATPNFLSIAEILHDPKPEFPASDATKKPPVFGKKPSSPTNIPLSSRRRTYAKVWGTVDRLELAMRKVETAQWEHERLRTNLASNSKTDTSIRADLTEEEKIHLSKFKKSLIQFGLKKEKIDQAIASVMTHHPSAGMRREVEQVVSENDVLFATLHHFGASWQDDKNNADSWIIKRWIPDFLEDILWEKIYETFETATDRLPENYGGIGNSVFTSDLEDQPLVQKRQAIQQAIDQVKKASMAIERLDDPQPFHHTQPIMRQSESRTSYLTVPTNMAMPRRASFPMKPPPKSGSISSPVERRTFDTSPEATQAKLEFDRPQSTRKWPSTMVGTRLPSDDSLGHPDSYRLQDTTQRSLDDANPRRYAGFASSSDYDDSSTFTGTHGAKGRDRFDSSTRSNPSLLPLPSIKRKRPKKEDRTTPSSSNLQKPDNPLPQSPPLQDPRQWFESEKHDKATQTVRDLLKRWTFLDLGDEDVEEGRGEQHSGREDDEDDAPVKRPRIGAKRESPDNREPRMAGGSGGGGGNGGDRSGDGGGQQKKKMKRS